MNNNGNNKPESKIIKPLQTCDNIIFIKIRKNLAAEKEPQKELATFMVVEVASGTVEVGNEKGTVQVGAGERAVVGEKEAPIRAP